MLNKFIAVLAAVLIYNLFFFRYLPVTGTLGFLLLIIITNLFFWASFIAKADKNSRHFVKAVISSFLSIAAAAWSVTKSNQVDLFLLSSLSLGLAGVSLYLLALDKLPFGALSEAVVLPWRLFISWFHSLTALSKINFSQLLVARKFLPKNKNFQDLFLVLLRGLVITIPVFLVLLFLLSGADPIFAHLVNQIINLELPEIFLTLPERLILSLFLILLLLPTAFLQIKNKYVSWLWHPKIKKYPGEMLIIVGSVALLLLVFLVIQFKYLFLTIEETKLHQFGVQTYSEYVRKGFVELLVVSVITYIVAGSALLVSRLQNFKTKILQYLNLFLLAELVVFIFSILKRVFVYQLEHGLTRVRIYGSAFVITLVFLTLILILRQINKKIIKFYLYEILIIIFAILGVSVINVDYLIATQFKPTVNEEIDYTYLAELSADGYQGWVEAFKHAQQTVANLGNIAEADRSRQLYYSYKIANEVYDNYLDLILVYGTQEELVIFMPDVEQNNFDWKNMNLKNFLVYQKLRQELNPKEVKDLYLLSRRVYFELKEVMPTMQEETRYDRSFDRPLL